jgi:hypothetical protein
MVGGTKTGSLQIHLRPEFLRGKKKYKGKKKKTKHGT